MSIVRYALRLAAKQALLGKTFAEDRVINSAIGELAAVVNSEPRPIVLLYTDDSTTRPGRELYTAGEEGTVTLTMLLGVAGAHTATNGETTFRFPHTDESMETIIDLMERQIRTALLDPMNPWAEVWRKVGGNVVTWKSVRGASAEQGARYAARLVTLECRVIDDPPPSIGAEGAGTVWNELLGLMAAAGGPLATIGALLGATIAGDPTLPSWRTLQHEAGLPVDAMRGTGLAPFVEGDETAPPLTEITIDGNDQTTTETAE